MAVNEVTNAPLHDAEARRMHAKRGPSDVASGRRKSPKDGARDVRQFAVGTWMCRQRTPATASESAAHGCAKDASAGRPSLW